MGRTIQPYSWRIESMSQEYKDFKRGLPRPKQEFYDEIFRMAKRNLASGVMSSNAYSMEPILISAMIELMSELKEIKSELAKIKSETRALKNGNL